MVPPMSTSATALSPSCKRRVASGRRVARRLRAAWPACPGRCASMRVMRTREAQRDIIFPPVHLVQASERRTLSMPQGDLLEGVTDAQERSLIEMATNQLQSNGQPRRGKTTGQRKRGLTGHIKGKGETQQGTAGIELPITYLDG